MPKPRKAMSNPLFGSFRELAAPLNSLATGALVADVGLYLLA